MELDPNFVAAIWLLSVFFLAGSAASLFEATCTPGPDQIEKVLGYLMIAYFDVSMLVFLVSNAFLLGFLREGRYGLPEDPLALLLSVGFIDIIGVAAMIVGRRSLAVAWRKHQLQMDRTSMIKVLAIIWLVTAAGIATFYLKLLGENPLRVIDVTEGTVVIIYSVITTLAILALTKDLPLPNFN